MSSHTKLLGSLPFVSRTFEGGFKENPFVLDLDGNLYIGPADHVTRDEHASIEVVYHFLAERQKISGSVRELLRSRQLLLDAFAAFDEARSEGEESDFRIIIFGTYDAVALAPIEDDELPAGPCGTPINVIKRRFYDICRRLDRQFLEQHLTQRQQRAEVRFVAED
ncbi:MAG: hypothetical protein QNJ82_13805 [Gammaproteobacteria bacterium]|nr:hypothetical protein [Gammaproteobacteria bacterium]